MSSNQNKSNEPPAYLNEEIPLPDDEWGPGSSAGPPEDAPPPSDDYMPSGEPAGFDSPPPPRDFPPPSAGPRSGSRSGPKSGSRSGSDQSSKGGERAFGRGEEVKIIGGAEGLGVVGEIFWWGDSKFGEGMRAGVRGPGDVTYWVDEEHLGWPDEDVPEEALAAAADQPSFGKGDRVRILDGKDAGTEGVIFWWGESKYGDGMRAGIKTDSEETVWSDASSLEPVEADPSAG